MTKTLSLFFLFAILAFDEFFDCGVAAAEADKVDPVGQAAAVEVDDTVVGICAGLDNWLA